MPSRPPLKIRKWIRRRYRYYVHGRPLGGHMREQREAACPIPGAHLMWVEGEELEPDWCRPLDDPHWIPASQAELMRDDDPVLGIIDGTSSWALPWWVMKNHHVANLELNKKRRLISFCEACSTGGLYDPVIGGTLFRWRVAGFMRGLSLHRDENTGSFWSALTMEPLHGPAIGLPRMERLPLVQCRWDEWLTSHPDTLVIDGEGEPRDGHGADEPDPDHRVLRTDPGPNPHPDRIDLLDVVLGVDLDVDQAAYALRDLASAGGVVNDRVGDREIVVVNRPGSWMASAFDRFVDGREVDLSWDGDNLVDSVSRRRWDLFGQPLDGTGAALSYVRSGLDKWYGFSAMFPGARLYEH